MAPHLPEILTKHCEPFVFDKMLEGKFWIGTLLQFRTSEGGGLMSDHAEGVGEMLVTEPLQGYTGEIAGNQFVDCDIGGGPMSSVRINTQIDCNVFCASIGQYRSDRHAALMTGTANYLGNPNHSVYLELDRQQLLFAIERACRQLFTGHRVVEGPVNYGSRSRTLSALRARTSVSQSHVERHTLETVFTKPERFALEEEYRIAILTNSTPVETIKTETLRHHVQRSFANAVQPRVIDEPST